MATANSKQNFEIQKIVAVTGIVLFICKIVAWYITHSVAILTDALESIVNVVSGLIGLYSLRLSARPKDQNHPYGHGKVEFLSAAIEGTLVLFAGLFILIEAYNKLRFPNTLQKLDLGIILIAFTAIVNYIVGIYAVRTGQKNNSLALTSSGKHLLTDTYSTVGIILGLIAIYITHLSWLDSAVAIIFALFIINTGYSIIRSSVAGIMDEADEKLLDKVVNLLNQKRRENWIDLHNLRIIKYGGVLHLDCHLTVPWYLNVRVAHDEVEALESLVKSSFGESLELFVHTDACLDFSCEICTKTDCDVRKANFVKRIEWNIQNISTNKRHKLS